MQDKRKVWLLLINSLISASKQVNKKEKVAVSSNRLVWESRHTKIHSLQFLYKLFKDGILVTLTTPIRLFVVFVVEVKPALTI